MQHLRAWATLRPLAVDGAPAQAALLLRAMLTDSGADAASSRRTHDRVALLVEIAFAEVLAHDFAAGLLTARRAVEEAAQPSCTAPGPRALATAMLSLAHLSRGASDATEFRELGEAVARARGLVGALDPHDEHAPMAHYFLAEAELTSGHVPAAEAVARRALAVALGSGSEPADGIAVLLGEQVLTRALVRRGKLVEAAGAAERLTRRAANGSLATLEGLGQGLVAFVTAVAGDAASSRRAGQRAIELASPSERSLLDTATVVWVAHARGIQQRYAEATDLLLKAAGGPAMPRLRWTDRAMAFELLVTAALAQGRTDEADAWVAALRRMGGAPLVVAATERTQAMVAAARGDHDSATTAQRARRSSQREGVTLDALRARVLHATALARSGQRKSALDELEDVARLSGEVGAMAMRAQAIREMRRLGRRYRGDTGWSALSDRERDVAELAGKGLTNRQVADQLYMSERTVQTHLETVFRALGIRSRTMLPLVIGGLTDPLKEEPPAPLTPRQAEVVALVAAGWTNARIAEALEMSVKTVEKHVRDVFVRWGVTTRTAVAALWQQHHAATA